MKLTTDKKYVLYYHIDFAEYLIREVYSFSKVFSGSNELNVIPILYTNSKDIAFDVKNKLNKEKNDN